MLIQINYLDLSLPIIMQITTHNKTPLKSVSSSTRLKTLGSSSATRKKQAVSMSRLHTLVNQKISKGYRYDKMLFHKTIFHLRPIADNPQLFTRDVSLSKQTLDSLKYQHQPHHKAVLPHPVSMSVKAGLAKVPGRGKMLRDDTLSHVTAKKWLIYNMQESYVVKGYKYRQTHDIASLSKLLTFYTAYDIVKEYFLVTSTFQLLVLPIDSKVGGTMLRLNQEEECQMTLQDALYALLMVSANNIAMAIANNLGSYIFKAANKQYFSCFDLHHESRDANVGSFMNRTKRLIKELGLQECVVGNPHGLVGNTASALDVARLAAQCFKIPLFSRIVCTRKTVVRTKDIDEDGEVCTRKLIIDNTNKLLEKGCIGGKTGSNMGGGWSFMGAFPGSMVIVVLGSAGQEERFYDCMRLAEWVGQKLVLAQQVPK